MSILSRRQFLTASASGLVAATAFRVTAPAWANAAQPLSLSVESRVIEVSGKAATVFAIRQPDGTPGLTVRNGERLFLALTNRIEEPTLIHWHGQTPPMAQDGVPDLSAAPLAPGQTGGYDFPARPGTHWMHSHHGLQEQRLMAAPLIVRENPSADIQEAVVLLHDFAFAPPEDLLAALQGGGNGHGNGHGAMPMSHSGAMMVDHAAHMRQMAETTQMPQAMTPMNMTPMDMAAHGPMMGPMGHANDIDYDAYLANDRTLDDPEIVRVAPGGRVRLRLINGATTTAFTIDTGRLLATVLSVDGDPVLPVTGNAFPLSMGQRIDLLVDIPRDGGAFPILAQRETAAERTGIILATAGARIEKIATAGDAAAGLIGLDFERTLAATTPLPARPVQRRITMTLGQTMGQYAWTLDGQLYGHDTPLEVRHGERVEITFQNMSMMSHPMHLHGHHFQVVAIGGERVNGAMRDTVLVPAGMGRVTVAFDADNPGQWPVHCHNLFHMATGMMTTLRYAPA